jgi:hypothetical protein
MLPESKVDTGQFHFTTITATNPTLNEPTNGSPASARYRDVASLLRGNGRRASLNVNLCLKSDRAP